MAAASGRSRPRASLAMMGCASPFQKIHFILEHRFPVAEEGDDDAQPHRCFCGGVRDNEQRENATRFMFAAFRINSMDISTTITLRRVTTPMAPIRKSAMLKNR